MTQITNFATNPLKISTPAQRTSEQFITDPRLENKLPEEDILHDQIAKSEIYNAQSEYQPQ